jgi:hypothetical protein
MLKAIVHSNEFELPIHLIFARDRMPWSAFEDLILQGKAWAFSCGKARVQGFEKLRSVLSRSPVFLQSVKPEIHFHADEFPIAHSAFEFEYRVIEGLLENLFDCDLHWDVVREFFDVWLAHFTVPPNEF